MHAGHFYYSAFEFMNHKLSFLMLKLQLQPTERLNVHLNNTDADLKVISRRLHTSYFNVQSQDECSLARDSTCSHMKMCNVQL